MYHRYNNDWFVLMCFFLTFYIKLYLKNPSFRFRLVSQVPRVWEKTSHFVSTSDNHELNIVKYILTSKVSTWFYIAFSQAHPVQRWSHFWARWLHRFIPASVGKIHQSKNHVPSGKNKTQNGDLSRRLSLSLTYTVKTKAAHNVCLCCFWLK